MGVIPVLGDYLEEAGVARHNFTRAAHDVLDLAMQTPHGQLSQSSLKQ
jgi:hypothetical protein